jgi:hypothetical protein
MTEMLKLDHIDRIALACGAHDRRDEGLCLMEAVAFVAGEPHTDRPSCVSPVLGAYGRALNDALPHELRQELKVFIPALPGTVGDGHDERRAYLALDWLIRVHTPMCLEAAGLPREAQSLRSLARIKDADSAALAWLVACPLRDELLAMLKRAPLVRSGLATIGAVVRTAVLMAYDKGLYGEAWAHKAGSLAQLAACAAVRTRVTATPTVTVLQRSAIDLFARMINTECAEDGEGNR